MKIDITNWKFWFIVGIVVFLMLWALMSKDSPEFIGIPTIEEMKKNYPHLLQGFQLPDDEEYETDSEGSYDPDYDSDYDSEYEHEDKVRVERMRNHVKDVEQDLRYVRMHRPKKSEHVPIVTEPIYLSINDEVVGEESKNYDPDAWEEDIKTRKKREKYESHGEELCRKCMEEMYPGYKFKNVRPKFLVNPETNRKLELDVYNEELKIAVEYNGPQHYTYPNPFHSSPEEFIKQRRRDIFKKEMCDLNGVYLISVPHTVNFKDIKNYLQYNRPENYEQRLEDEKLLKIES